METEMYSCNFCNHSIIIIIFIAYIYNLFNFSLYLLTFSFFIFISNEFSFSPSLRLFFFITPFFSTCFLQSAFYVVCVSALSEDLQSFRSRPAKLKVRSCWNNLAFCSDFRWSVEWTWVLHILALKKKSTSPAQNLWGT